MSSKGSSMMKSAQAQKTKIAVQQLVQWYSSKQEFYKVYLPIQQVIVKRIFNATQITIGRLKDFVEYFTQEKQIYAATFEKNEKSVICDEGKYQPKNQQSSDPKSSKGPKPVGVDLPPWSGNIDRVLIALSRNQKQKQAKLKKVHKALETIQESLIKEEAKYKGQLRKFQKQLESTFDKIDQLEKEQSKRFAKILKQSKSEQMKDSSFFIGQIKKMEKYIFNEIQLFANRGKIIVDMIQGLLKLEKEASKKIKDELIGYRNIKQSVFGSDMKGQEDIWGQVSLIEEKIQVERVTYFNKTLLKSQRIEDLKKILTKIEAKNNWQVIIGFLSTNKDGFSQIIKAEKTISLLLKTISYRCWPKIALAEGWLIQSYTPAVMYMTYDSIMLIYNKQGQCLKKIHTGSSKVSKVQGNTIYLSQKIKGFFTDSIQEYKIRFQQVQRLEQFQLFIQNQIN